MVEAFFLTSRVLSHPVVEPPFQEELGRISRIYSSSNEVVPSILAMLTRLESQTPWISLPTHLLISDPGKEALNSPFTRRCILLTKCRLNLNIFAILTTHQEGDTIKSRLRECILWQGCLKLWQVRNRQSWERYLWKSISFGVWDPDEAPFSHDNG